jgi:AraC-like DNA-binding protein
MPDRVQFSAFGCGAALEAPLEFLRRLRRWDATEHRSSNRKYRVRVIHLKAADMVESLAGQPTVNSVSLRVRMALAYLECSYANPDLRLNTVAKHVRVSPHHLSGLIKKETGQGFRRHLIAIRFEMARRHLATSLMSVKEIAISVGYNSTSSFDREFRRCFNCSPTDVRTDTSKSSQVAPV